MWFQAIISTPQVHPIQPLPSSVHPNISRDQPRYLVSTLKQLDQTQPNRRGRRRRLSLVKLISRIPIWINQNYLRTLGIQWIIWDILTSVTGTGMESRSLPRGIPIHPITSVASQSMICSNIQNNNPHMYPRTLNSVSNPQKVHWFNLRMGSLI